LFILSFPEITAVATPQLAEIGTSGLSFSCVFWNCTVQAYHIATEFTQCHCTTFGLTSESEKLKSKGLLFHHLIVVLAVHG